MTPPSEQLSDDEEVVSPPLRRRCIPLKKKIAVTIGIIFLLVAYSAYFTSTILAVLEERGKEEPSYSSFSYTSMKEEVPVVENTSIVIVSALSKNNITTMIDLVIKSFVFVEGLSPSAPIYIAIDGLVEEGSYFNTKHGYPPNNEEIRLKIDTFIRDLRIRYNNDNRVQILPFVSWHMHSNVIKSAMELVKTKYVHVIEHDEAFIRPINQTAIMHAMEEYPSVYRKVEFTRNNNTDCNDHYWHRGPCSCNVTTIGSTSFTKSSGWSDQAHFTTKEYYLEVLAILNGAVVHPEFPMNRLAHKGCDKWGAHLYGGINDTHNIVHMDGRSSRKGPGFNYTGIILEAYYRNQLR